MDLDLQGVEKLTNNVTEQHFFALFSSTHSKEGIEYLDKMFCAFLHEGGHEGRYNSNAFYFYMQLRESLMAANKEYKIKRDLLRESELIKQKLP